MTKTFVPVDGQPVGQAGLTRIVVYPDIKVRYSGGRLNNNTGYHIDPWPLHRADVPHLSDEDWYACPTGWKEVQS